MRCHGCLHTVFEFGAMENAQPAASERVALAHDAPVCLVDGWRPWMLPHKEDRDSAILTIKVQRTSCATGTFHLAGFTHLLTRCEAKLCSKPRWWCMLIKGGCRRPCHGFVALAEERLPRNSSDNVIFGQGLVVTMLDLLLVVLVHFVVCDVIEKLQNEGHHWPRAFVALIESPDQPEAMQLAPVMSSGSMRAPMLWPLFEHLGEGALCGWIYASKHERHQLGLAPNHHTANALGDITFTIIQMLL